MDIIITVNGKKESVKPNTRILDFLSSKKLNPDRVVVEYNLDVLKREDLEHCILEENDNLEVMRIVGGG
jgi:sulfur carrier protein